MRAARPSLLECRHWGTIAEAGLALAAVSVATRLLPFKRYIKLGARPLDRAGRVDSDMAPRIMDALGRRVPFRAVCLQRGIALQWMLRRRGVDAVLHYGVRMPSEGNKLTAHVWISVNEVVLLGSPQHEHYTEVARYPGSR